MLSFKGFKKKKEEEKDEDVEIPHATSEHHVDKVLYHGTNKEIRGHINPTKTKGMGLPEPTGVSLTASKRTAEQFGKHIHSHHFKGRVGDAELFMKRARQHMRRGSNDDEASHKTQEEFKSKGYHGVRWGDREIISFHKVPLDK